MVASGSAVSLGGDSDVCVNVNGGGRSVDVQACDVPVSLGESGRIRVDVIDASGRAGGRVSVAGPITTERQVNDDVLRCKVALNVSTVVVDKVGVRFAPSGRIDASAILATIDDVIGHISSIVRPEPDVDERCRAL